MKRFSFSLQYQCQDSALGNHPDIPGMLSVDYVREADTARQAVFGALAELREIVPNGYLVGVGPDLLGFAGVARLFELNTRNMRAVMAKVGALFPAPKFIGSDAVWHSADILGLMAAQGWREIAETELEMAQLSRAMNRAIQGRAE